MKALKTTVNKILILHGPNLNLLGLREPGVYGSTNLTQINQQLEEIGRLSSVEINCFQSNHEGELIDKVQQAINNYKFIVINPAALTHTSVGLRDALLAVKIPFIEVHLSNVYAREEFRHKSFLSDIAVGVISGLGAIGYELALTFAIKHVLEKE